MIYPKIISGASNFYVNLNANDESGKFKTKPISGSNEFFLNYKNFVLDGRTNYSDKKLHRGDIKITQDIPEKNLRYQYGDVYLPYNTRLSNIRTLGVKVEKIFDMSYKYNNRDNYRVNSYEFFLKENSLVEVYVRGKLEKTLNLQAGTNSIYDLNIPTGVHIILLKIIEEGGKIEFIEFNDFSYTELYKKGYLRYGLGTGVDSKSVKQKNRV